jgi:hypothetical protein
VARGPEHRRRARGAVHPLRADDRGRPQRSPAGTESAWAYKHLPRDIIDDECADQLAATVDRVLEERAPGFGPTSLEGRCNGRRIWTPTTRTCPAARSTVVRPSCNNEVIFRPTPGFGRAETPARQRLPGQCLGQPRRQRARYLRRQRRAGGTEIRRLAGMAAPSAQPNGHLAAGQITRCPLQATSTTGDGSVFVTATR